MIAEDIPFVVGLAGLGESANRLAWTLDNSLGPAGPIMRESSVAQTANRFGPLTYNVGNLKNISFVVTPNASNPTGTEPVFHASDATQWVVGLAGLAESTGTVTGALDNTFGGGNGGIADGYLTLQTANRFGPAFFDLTVLKALSFTQPPNGEVLANGQLDDFRAIDIGRWRAGIPGIITNTGTVGFIVDRGYGVGLGTFNMVWGLRTTTQIGSLTFDFNFLPAISFPSMAFTPFGELAPGAPPEIDVPITSPLADGSAVMSGLGAPPAEATAGPAGISPTPSTPSTAARIEPVAEDRDTDGLGPSSPGASTPTGSPGLPSLDDLRMAATDALSPSTAGETDTGANPGSDPAGIPGLGGPSADPGSGADPGSDPTSGGGTTGADPSSGG